MKTLAQLGTWIVALGGALISIFAGGAAYVPFGEGPALLAFLVGICATIALIVIMSMLIRIAYRG